MRRNATNASNGQRKTATAAVLLLCTGVAGKNTGAVKERGMVGGRQEERMWCGRGCGCGCAGEGAAGGLSWSSWLRRTDQGAHGWPGVGCS